MRSIYAIIMTMLVLANSAFADTVTYKTGTIEAIDLESDTFKVVLDRTLELKTYAFPAKVNSLAGSPEMFDKAMLEPGMKVRLKFASPGTAAVPRALTMKGTVVKIDRTAGTGTLLLDKPSKYVPFRFARDLELVDMPRPGDEVVFTYLEGEIENVDHIKLVME